MNNLVISLNLVKLDEEDIPHLIELSNKIGWDYDKHEIQTIISTGKVFGHKKKDGTLVSSAAIISYGSNLASIGMVIVEQNFRGKGLGKRVIQKCLDTVPDYTTVMLISTDEGKPLYHNMGFTAIDTVHKYICEKYRFVEMNNSVDIEVNSIHEEDIPYVVKLDKDAFGEERKDFILYRIKQAKEALLVKDRVGKIIAFGLSISGPAHLLLGPIVAPNNYIASVLINRLAYHHQGSLRIDVPSGQEAFMSHIETCGFVNVNQPPIMIKNSQRLPRRNHTLYGIAAQAFG